MNTYLITLIWRGSEITVEVEAATVADARKIAYHLHPHGQIIAVEREHHYS